MVKEKLSRKELLKDPDKMISTTALVVKFIKQETRLVSVCVIGIVVIGLALWALKTHNDRRESQAQDLQSQGYQLYRKALEQTDETTSKDLLEKAMDRFEEVIQKFEGTHASQMAHMYRGHAAYALGRYAEAIEDYKAASSKMSSPEMRALALQGVAYSLMSKGDLEAAIEAFKKLEDLGGAGFRGTVQWNIARCYEQQGKVQDALEIYKDIMQTSRDHVRRTLAEAKVAELAAK
jgi:tetratricopeptide (TPR) repeat protein